MNGLLAARVRQIGPTAAVVLWAILLSLTLGWIARRAEVAPPDAPAPASTESP